MPKKRTPAELAAHRQYERVRRLRRGDAIRAKDRARYKRDRVKKCDYQKRYRMADPARAMYQSAKSSSKWRKLAFALQLQDIVIPTHCPYLGLKLEYREGPRRDNSPTLDRIDNTLGYLPGNIEVISWRANFLKNNAKPSEALLMARAFLDRFGG